MTATIVFGKAHCTQLKFGRQNVGKLEFNLNYLGFPWLMLFWLVVPLCQNGNTLTTLSLFFGNLSIPLLPKLTRGLCLLDREKAKKGILPYTANMFLLDCTKFRVGRTKALLKANKHVVNIVVRGKKRMVKMGLPLLRVFGAAFMK